MAPLILHRGTRWNLRSVPLPSFFTPEDIAPATFRKWDCKWKQFSRKSLLEHDAVQFSRWLL